MLGKTLVIGTGMATTPILSVGTETGTETVAVDDGAAATRENLRTFTVRNAFYFILFDKFCLINLISLVNLLSFYLFYFFFFYL